MNAWDILHLDEEEWEHLQILDRLHEEGIDCYMADIFLGEVVFLSGCKPNIPNGAYEIATALNIPESVVFFDEEHCFCFINLYKLRAIRNGVDEKIQK